MDGWRLRFTPGVQARRSNSVLTLDGLEGPLEPRLGIVEEFYGAREMPARYQISPATNPAGLEGSLADRGYRVEVRVNVQTARLDDVLRSTEAGRWELGVTDQPDDSWMALWTEMSRRGEPRATRERVLDRVPAPIGFALIEIDDQPASVGYGVVERGWLGVFGMGTAPHARRRGAATAVLHALARWASALGATGCYLQVEKENEGAHRLYERAGFSTRYEYHYRTREA